MIFISPVAAVVATLVARGLTTPVERVEVGKDSWSSSSWTPSSTAPTSVPSPASSSTSASYDFIIVGGGTAGLALADRLTESGTQDVLVLEAGPAPTIVAAYKAPGADQQLSGSPIDWAFTTLPQKSLNGRQITYDRGRCLGGSSAINGLTYGRGSPSVYDLWESLGNPGWSWNDVYPLFVKSTHFNPPTTNTSYQGYDPSAYSDGPVQVGYPGPYYASSGASAFVDSLGAIGVEPTNELNAGNNVGAKQEPLTIDTDFHRSSAYDNYYMAASGRPNLKVLTYAPVQRLILEQQGSDIVTTGVVYTDYASGSTLNVTATKEVIMSAGSIQTPQLLLLSGIGPASTLTKSGIQAYIVNENVGMKLQDHTYFSIIARTQVDVSISSIYNDVAVLQTAEQQFRASQGPLTAHNGPSFGFQMLNASTIEQLDQSGSLSGRGNQSHIEYYYEDFFYPSDPTPEFTPFVNESFISFTAGLIAPVSRGSVSIKSSSNGEPPQIDLDYYTAPTDQAIAVYAFKNLRTVLARYAGTFGNTIGPNNGEVSPGLSVESDEDILNYIRSTALPVYHASGTCAMLPQGSGGVVDSRLRVYGVQGLRIADASIIPVIPDQHTQGPVYMIAEKAAQLLKEDYGF